MSTPPAHALRHLPLLLLALLPVTLAHARSHHPEALPHATVTMTIVQSGGEATLEWVAEPGFLYTLMYAPDRGPNAQWRAHPDYTRIRGEGQKVVARDRVPHGVQRHYRLHVEPIGTGQRRR